MREAARTIKDLGVPIDGIVCYPTIMAADWQKTADGIESHFQNNYLAYFVLVNALLEVMLPGSRVVLMTTSIRREAPAPRWEDINFAVSFWNTDLLMRNGSGYLVDWDWADILCRMGRDITLLMGIRSRCLRIFCSPNRWRRYALKKVLLHSRLILGVSDSLRYFHGRDCLKPSSWR
jgi:NAD(P)-dependent dehydrogenase (short-subunit alcohol dehydrogenase family)